ncbi:MAG: hypothetical protein LBR18_03440 [Tannerella sp.]|jgi:hypothetical protein|nr:hypothetical protein [Tannerella sp.]
MKDDITFVTLDDEMLTMGDASFVDIDSSIGGDMDFVQIDSSADYDMLIDTGVDSSSEFIVMDDVEALMDLDCGTEVLI